MRAGGRCRTIRPSNRRRRTSMKIHEYQAKEILRKYGVATPRGVPCFSVEEAVAAARELGGKVWVVKAQIHAGGRGKGGGVKVTKSESRSEEHTSELQSQSNLVCRLLLEKKKKKNKHST